MKSLLGLEPTRSKKRVPPNANVIGWTGRLGSPRETLCRVTHAKGWHPSSGASDPRDSRSDQGGSLFSHLGSDLPSLLPHPVDQACNSVGRAPQGHIDQKGGTLGATLEAASHSWHGTLCLSTLLASPGEFQISLVPRHLF